MAHETRHRFHDELAALESEILGLGDRATMAVSSAVQALAHKDEARGGDLAAAELAMRYNMVRLRVGTRRGRRRREET